MSRPTPNHHRLEVSNIPTALAHWAACQTEPKLPSAWTIGRNDASEQVELSETLHSYRGKRESESQDRTSVRTTARLGVGIDRNFRGPSKVWVIETWSSNRFFLESMPFRCEAVLRAGGARPAAVEQARRETLKSVEFRSVTCRVMSVQVGKVQWGGRKKFSTCTAIDFFLGFFFRCRLF
jgi:hypothetical protein